MLDAWFRELCFNYRYMPPLARAAIRVFLNFDMTRPLDIFVQDQLAWGVVEIPKTDGAVVIIQQKALKVIQLLL